MDLVFITKNVVDDSLICIFLIIFATRINYYH